MFLDIKDQDQMRIQESYAGVIFSWQKKEHFGFLNVVNRPFLTKLRAIEKWHLETPNHFVKDWSIFIEIMPS